MPPQVIIPLRRVLFSGIHGRSVKTASESECIVVPPGYNTFRVACARPNWPAVAKEKRIIRVRADWSIDGGRTWEHLCGFRALGKYDGKLLFPDDESAIEIPVWRYQDMERLIRIEMQSFVDDLPTEIRFAATQRALTRRPAEEPHSVAYDDFTASGSFAGVASFSYTNTPIGTPSAVALQLACSSGAGTDSFDLDATYGGTAMAEGITARSSTITMHSMLRGLANPASGNQVVNVSFTGSPSGGGYGYAGTTTVTGSDTSTCFSSTASTTGDNAASPSSVSITAASDELTVDAIGNFVGGGAALTPDGSQTQQFNGAVSGNQNSAGSYKSGATSAMTWTYSGTCWRAHTAGVFKVSGGGGGAQPWFWAHQQGNNS